MAHDFKRWPELTNNQMRFYYWESPHKQIMGNFRPKVTRIIDGDTVEVTWSERDFKFPIRMSNIAAPELDEEGGEESKSWLERQIGNEDVDIIVNPKRRVEKWGRLLGEITHLGMNINEESIRAGQSIPFEQVGNPPNF